MCSAAAAPLMAERLTNAYTGQAARAGHINVAYREATEVSCTKARPFAARTGANACDKRIRPLTPISTPSASIASSANGVEQLDCADVPISIE